MWGGREGEALDAQPLIQPQSHLGCAGEKAPQLYGAVDVLLHHGTVAVDHDGEMLDDIDKDGVVRGGLVVARVRDRLVGRC